jgi:hypothetical protein
MRRIPAILAAAGILTLALASPASAAPGVVLVTDHHGRTHEVFHPRPFHCHPAGGHHSSLRNFTRGTVLIFPDRHCRTRIFLPVHPGGVHFGNIGSFFAVD